MLLKVLQQTSSVPMHNAFGFTRRARRIHDEQWMTECDPPERDGFRQKSFDEVVPAASSRRVLKVTCGTIGDTRYHYFLRRQVLTQALILSTKIDFFARVIIPFDQEQDLGLDLSKAIDDTCYTKVRRTG